MTCLNKQRVPAFLQDGVSRAKADIMGEGHVMNLLTAVFLHWNGIEGMSDGGTRMRVKGCTGKLVRKYVFIIPSLDLWDLITLKI